MSSYYDNNTATTANAPELIPVEGATPHFPSEGLYIGELTGGSAELPALVDLREINGLCFLYNNESDRRSVNSCLEKLVWRIALTVPANLCELVLYNGGYPGDALSVHSRINKYLFDDRRERVYFDGNSDAFLSKVNDIYVSIVDRMSTIRLAGKSDLVELNESLGNDARLKYEFIVLTDFPHHLRAECAQRIAQIVESGRKAGVYVLMSWDMNADIQDPGNTSFDARRMLSSMEILFPQGGRYEFRGSGHDEAFNRFDYVIDNGPADLFVIEKCLQYIDIQAETARKAAKPSVQKQDFESLEKAAYEPVMNELSITVGLDVRDRHPVTLKFTSGDYIHGFILGQSGSGKSVLLNNIITSLILKYSPEDLMLYLMDFKGIEFNRYRGVKHTKAVLVDNSDPQMTLAVLRELKEENDRRRKLFGNVGVTSIDAYNRLHSNDRIPQVLFVADECQVMFKEPTGSTQRIIHREITDILNTIATQGRSQGIHMLLATQQLDEADISGEILKNLTECFLLMSAPGDSNRLVPESSDLTSKQMTGIACYYHKKELQSQLQTFYATGNELASTIAAAEEKAGDCPGNGGHYFCGSSLYYLADDMEEKPALGYDCPVAYVGRSLGINAGTTIVPLQKDFMEHILVWGTNKKEQATGVLMNAFLSLIFFYRRKGIACKFLAIDCLPGVGSRYKMILSGLEEKGLCRIIPRQESGAVLKELTEDIRNDFASPTVLAIIGSERFIEVKRKLPLVSGERSAMMNEEGVIGFDMANLDLMNDADEIDAGKMTFPQALMYLLDEGSLHDVHILMQLDKPANILFGDEYDVEAANKFRHKIILRSENKYLGPLRFSQEIDVEILSDEEEHLRAWYYPDGDDPVLFTPYQMPDISILNNL
ncbi:MAG: hypothetical protein IJG35_03335 [Bacteroidales bacterium]|nr:hypothetical protein [Bacteroidales bacterium]